MLRDGHAAPPRPRTTSRQVLDLLPRLWPWSPLALAALYAAALLTTLRSVVNAVYATADTVSAPYLGELLPHAHGGTALLGNISWAEALWFELLTRGLPEHRQLWELAPWLVGLAAIGAVAWTASVVAGRWAGMVVAVTLGCSGTALLPLQFAWNTHALGYTNCCLLGAFTVLLARREFRIGGRPATHFAALVAISLVVGAGVASDPLSVIAGLIPFVLTGAVVARAAPREPARRAVTSVVGVAAGSALVAWLIDLLMHEHHLIAQLRPYTLSPFNQLLDHVGVLGESLAVLMNGNFGGAPPSTVGGLSLLCALCVAAGCYAAVGFVRSQIRGLLASPRSAIAPGCGRDLGHAAYVCYWTSSGIIVSAAFIFSSFGVDIASKRYVVTVAYSIAALLPIAAAASVRARLVLATGICVILTGSASAMLNRDVQAGADLLPTGQDGVRLLQWAQSEHVTTGYAEYLVAAPLTWETDGRVQVYPVAGCFTTAVCPWGRPRISSWYRIRRGIRTFLAVDTTLAANLMSEGIQGAPSSLGRPQQTATIGPLTVFVYPFDIASRFRTSP